MKFTTAQITWLISIILICFFSIAGYQMYLENQPPKVNKEIIEEKVAEIFEQDSIINIPIEISYKYKDAIFESNGDTTYWFYRSIYNNGNHHSTAIMFPYSYFDFAKAANKITDGKGKDGAHFIMYFKQISKASYLTYSKYSDKY